MSRPEKRFDACRAINASEPNNERPLRFEIFVGAGFSGYELAAITHTLSVANEITARAGFAWRIVSDTPGLVNGMDGMIVRAEPAIDNHGFSDVMIVIGGKSAGGTSWISRARAMQRKALAVVLLSDAATAYIRTTKSPSGKVTTHWRHAAVLAETGYHPNLTARFAESSDGIITAAGSGATSELVIGLIAPHLQPPQVAELCNHLLLPAIRKGDAEQPRDIADNTSLFDERVTAAIKLMEDTIADPLSMPELTDRVGVSTRHLERVFRAVFNKSPARFYKQLRTRRARAIIEETLLPMADIAAATGFGSCNTLSKAIKDEYGLSPSKMRARVEINLLPFESA